MQNTWSRLEKVLSSKFPKSSVGSLRKGATQQSIDRVEKTLGFSFPAELREAYRRFDGVNYGLDLDSAGRIPRLIVPYYDWASLSYVESKWISLRQIAEAIPFDEQLLPKVSDECEVRDGTWMEPRWIPIGDSGTESYAAIDMNPGPAGKVGQLIRVDESTGIASVIADSFGSYISALTSAIEEGLIVASDGEWTLKRTGEYVSSLKQISR